MKILTLILLLFPLFSLAQVEGKVELTKDQALAVTAEENIKVKGLKFGISLGFSTALDRLYDARISPIDTSLVLQRTPSFSFLLSTTVSIPIAKGIVGGAYYRKLDAAGNPVGDAYFVPYGFSILATVNIATFNNALGSGGGFFNKQLDGGLGIAYSVSDNVQVALTAEMMTFRQSRNYLNQLNGKKIMVNNSALTSLPVDNNDFFIDKYIPSLSLKVVYILNDN